MDNRATYAFQKTAIRVPNVSWNPDHYPINTGVWNFAPAHGKLADGFDKGIHDQLMTANLIRTLAWTVCGACSIWMVLSMWDVDRADQQGT